MPASSSSSLSLPNHGPPHWGAGPWARHEWLKRRHRATQPTATSETSRYVPGRLIHTPKEDLFSFWLFPPVLETLGRDCQAQEPTTSWVGLSLGFHTLSLSHRVSQRCLSHWKKQVLLLPTCLSLHTRKQLCFCAREDGLPKGVPTVSPEHQPGKEAAEQQLLCVKCRFKKDQETGAAGEIPSWHPVSRRRVPRTSGNGEHQRAPAPQEDSF